MVNDNDIKNWCMSMRISVAMVKVMMLACKLVGVKGMKEAAVGVFFSSIRSSCSSSNVAMVGVGGVSLGHVRLRYTASQLLLSYHHANHATVCSPKLRAK